MPVTTQDIAAMRHYLEHLKLIDKLTHHMFDAACWPALPHKPYYTTGVQYVASLRDEEKVYGHYSRVLTCGQCASFAGDIDSPSNSFRLFAIAEGDM